MYVMRFPSYYPGYMYDVGGRKIWYASMGPDNIRGEFNWQKSISKIPTIREVLE